MFDKLFGRKKKNESPETKIPPVSFGRYSDNNKTLQKTKRWTDADNLFKENRYHESIVAFFDYLRDDAVQNVTIQSSAAEQQFSIYQGSKLVRGRYTNETLSAEVTLARMAQPSVPVMRRLLEQNFNLYYCRYGMEADRLCMRFDTELATANPNKLYYAFKELATRADKQDDLLLQDFQTLLPIDTEHIETIPDSEKEVKYNYLQQWITETVTLVNTLDADKMSNAISMLLLNLAYRIDFLLVPEGRILYDLEDLVTGYFLKDEKPVIEKNRTMLLAFQAIAAHPKEIVFACLFRSKHSFAITQPTQQKTISDSVFGSNQNMLWFRDNNYPEVAQQISEYGFSYCQYNFSLPKPVSDLYLTLMKVSYAAFFADIGFSPVLYNNSTGEFNVSVIEQAIEQIINSWKEKYPQLAFKTENLKYDSILSFTHSFTSEIEFVNTEIK
ncbi:hypothetical protein ESA94_09915 [Lacibacter luteus]|uniref:YbjN domain-containing protein n=1 Tax=Lacibacter luteus TaxID=2508719 RepID=A0A4Q1CJI4_9BACT|nr:hypothetical protein [Lacibacter luteus]RXK60770.1 hypothetical protein ESA94_09915 [Lacibacter luteus]